MLVLEFELQNKHPLCPKFLMELLLAAIVDLIKMSLNSNGKATDDTIDSCLKFITDVSDKMKNN